MIKLKRAINQMVPLINTQFNGSLLSNHSSGIHTRSFPFHSFNKTPKKLINFTRHFTNSSIQTHSSNQEIVIALGSNVGDRMENFNKALQLMRNYGIKITRHSCLYETVPAYVTDQPLFLNSAIRGLTNLGPHDLLKILKKIETELGRTKNGIRYGPRPIDLDILFYGNSKIETETLIIPHERIFERSFVLAPLVDLLGLSKENETVASWHSFAQNEKGLFGIWDKLGGESLITNKEGVKRVFPIKNQLLDLSNKTLVMGILNLTPDSFSDGGKFTDLPSQISQFNNLISQGADIIDIGAQSTRPNAQKLTVEQELERLIPFLDKITKIPLPNDLILSIDTFYADVAREAIKRGVNMVNDVSGGKMDTKMLKTVRDLNVPYVIMHMRGNPSTMQNCKNVEYQDLIKEIADELHERISDAESEEIPLWRIILDPGIGFSKNSEQNLELISNISALKEEIGELSFGASRSPVLIGVSRKKFLGEILGKEERERDVRERDIGSVAAICGGVLGGARIIRVHNVGFGVDAVRVCDALLKYKRN
ncbi:hypothetical protein LUZ60_004945 [Juncus effusus]|nr:hypothetical protein LUZ60_004945 [Juncus effusus]